MKICQWEPSCSIRLDRQTDMKQPLSAFRNFAKVPKIVHCFNTYNLGLTPFKILYV